MIIEHIAIWTKNLEGLAAYYIKFFQATPSEKYINEKTGFQSYFLSFESGARLEIMYKNSVPDNKNDTIKEEYLGIIHLAFGVDTMAKVTDKCEELLKAGYRVISGPRKTGDGYYEFVTLDPDNNRLEVTTKY
ncbi:VOC family protein [uncultured Maribacter sp.]|nr:VOC family protein [uncultured Maribacter sp.]